MSTQISYLGYCQLGGARNPNLLSRAVYLGPWFMGMTYWLIRT